MAVHAIELRWKGHCARCHAELAAGELARFDDVTRQISCPDCRSRSVPATDRAKVKQMIAEARAALAGAPRAG